MYNRLIAFASSPHHLVPGSDVEDGRCSGKAKRGLSRVVGKASWKRSPKDGSHSEVRGGPCRLVSDSTCLASCLFSLILIGICLYSLSQNLSCFP